MVPSDTLGQASSSDNFAVEIRDVSIEHPWRWLAAGTRDMMRAPVVSIGYGLGITLLSFAITAALFAGGLQHWLLPLAAGFLLIAPVLAVGFYDMSRRLEHGQRPSFGAAISAWRSNPVQISLMGLTLMIFFLFWVRLATLLFALFFGNIPTGLAGLLEATLSTQGVAFLAFGGAIGGILAFLAFALSVVSVPMLVDRQATFMDAITASLQAVYRNLDAMLLWAALLAALTIAGLVTFYLGLALILPLLGHASWHAYRDMVAAEVPKNPMPGQEEPPAEA